MFWGPGAGAQLDPPQGRASGSSSEDDSHANGFGGDGRRARDPAVGLPVRTEAAECGACWVTRLSQARHYSALISMANKKGTYQVQTNLFVQTMKISIWAIKSTSKRRGAERWEGEFTKV